MPTSKGMIAGTKKLLKPQLPPPRPTTRSDGAHQETATSGTSPVRKGVSRVRLSNVYTRTIGSRAK